MQNFGHGNVSSQESIFVINPGSTSTKVAQFSGENESSRAMIQHDAASLSKFVNLWDQFEMRLEAVRTWAVGVQPLPVAIAGIGGLLRPLSGGTYKVNEKMLKDARSNLQGAHASNLGCALAHEMAQRYACNAYVVDPVSVDEFSPIARYSGHPSIERSSLSHALNIHATARRASLEIGKDYNEAKFVIAHMGGGISVAPVEGGMIVDVNDASSDGPFSPERSGGLPLQQFISLCFSGKYGENEMRSLVMGKGGLRAYLGTNSALEVEKRIESGDELAMKVFEAMAYQIAKEIGAMATVLSGRIDAIILTGGLASSKRLIQLIISRVQAISSVIVYPGEDEMSALAHGVLRVIRGQEEAKDY